MEDVIRAFVMYLFLFIILRVSGKRSMAEISPFSFVLLLIVAESTQQALLGNDFSLTTAIVVITVLVGMDILLTGIKQRFSKFESWMEGTPLVLVDNGRPLTERMKKVHIDESDILTAARLKQGIEHLGQIKYAVLEKSGGISIIPR